MTFTVHRTFHVRNNGRCGAPVMREGKAPVVGERVPRVAKLMALAIRFDGLILSFLLKRLPKVDVK